MATNHHGGAATPDTLITIKVVFEGSNRKFKLPLQDLNVQAFPEKLCSLLQIPSSQRVVLERFSDSGNAYVNLDQVNPGSAYKQLYRAAKAKGKLRIRASIPGASSIGPVPEIEKHEQPTLEASTQPTAARGAHAFENPFSTQRSPPRPCAVQSKEFASPHIRDDFFQHLVSLSHERNTGHRMCSAPPKPMPSTWQIFCNNCDKIMGDAHYHCSVCDGGDFDLCEGCVEDGKTCPGEGHWLIKRFIKNGNIETSTTEKVTAKPSSIKKDEQENPITSASEVKEDELTRTCNSCVRVLAENSFVTCKDCPDFDLCVPCIGTEHGHHPAHSFQPAVPGSSIDAKVTARCAPGGDMRHYAICDGCDETIFGIRHKCLKCPDWDLCNSCIKDARKSHPEHRFVPIYTTLEIPASPKSQHFGIFCDGPLCSGRAEQSYIKGIRYKCAICHDTDFCANCEAHPSNRHNETHPLIKFKTPVHGASITTVETKPGQGLTSMGDKSYSSASARWVHRAPTHTMTHPNISNSTLPPYRPSLEAQRAAQMSAQMSAKAELAAPSQSAELDAHFVKDTVADGTKVMPTQSFIQTWTLKNPGPNVWPAGCTVSYIGGDRMLQVDGSRSAPSAELMDARKSNATTGVVAVGETYDFNLKMQAPPRAGTFISYWRLKAPDGTPFGHKLWCDIEVKVGALEDYQNQLILLDQQNKARLAKARLELTASRFYSQIKEESNKVGAANAEQTEVGSLTRGINELVSCSAGASVHAATVEDSEEAGEATTDDKDIAEQTENMEGSVMVFPTLEKESPESSTYQDAASTAPSVASPPEVSQPAPAASVTSETETISVAPTEENFDDSVSFEDSGDESGFLTDEEYDILDASDEEVVTRGRSG